MQHDSLDREFQAFRATRDPAALALVFDAAAPRLLLVAMHLCRDAATAEDLVQTVFLQVLRDVDRFDPRRPVMPWLLGMLEHRASDHRRRAHVRHEQAGDAAAIAGGPSPERAAAANEVRDRVAEALAGMPRDYRDVLTLRLVHGLSAVEIAHAHGLQPATVRTRLRRGLELLRGALPRGLATHGLLALLAAELAIARDGLFAVRTKVLGAAAAGAGVSIAAGWWLALAAALVLAAGSWWWFTPVASIAPRVDRDATAIAANAASDREHDRDAMGKDTAQLSPGRTAVADPRTTTVRGRAIDSNSGMPIGGVTATLRTFPSNGIDDPDWRDPVPVVAAADGTFAVEFVPSRHRGVELGLATAGYVDEFVSWEPLREGVDVDAGDVELMPGTPVRLRLLCDGKPLGGAETYANHAPHGRPSGVRGYGTSDTEGLVDLGMCVPGSWWHEVQTHHLGAEGPFDVPLQRAPLVVTVELREPPRDRSISGVLVDTDGAPVTGVELRMPMPGRGHFTTTTRTDGRFLWARSDPPLRTVRERIELPQNKRGELEWIEDGGELAWGTNDLRLVVRRRAPATLRLEVFDAATLQPVESFGATCKNEVGSCNAERRRVPAEQHDGGIATFALAPGTWLVSVFPGERFAEYAEIPVQLVEGRTTTVRVPLRPPAELSVEVADAATGVPLEGVQLALAKAVPSERARTIASSWYQLLCKPPGTTGTNPEGAVIVLARGTSDAQGRVSLHAPAGVAGLVLVAGGPRCIASEHHGVVLPEGGARTTLHVTPAAVVTGRVTPLAFVERFGPTPERLAEAAANARTQWTESNEFANSYPCVALRRVGGAPQHRFTTHVGPDGTFTIGGVPAGRFTVHIDTVLGNPTHLGALATIDVDPAHPPPPLVVDVTTSVPARGTVRFFVDGAPAIGEGGLARLVDGGTSRLEFPLGADGSASTPWLLPGTYMPFVAGGGDEYVFGTDRLVVTAGGSIDATFALQRRAVTIRIEEANGEPARDVFVWIDAIDPPGLGRCPWLPRRTDADGHLVLAAAPPGRLRLRAFARDQDLRDTNVEPALLLGEVAAEAMAATFRMPR